MPSVMSFSRCIEDLSERSNSVYLCSISCVSFVWVDRTPEGPRAPQLDHSWTLLGAMNMPTQPDKTPAAEKFDTPSQGSRGGAWCVAWNGDEGSELDGHNDDGGHNAINNIISLPEIS